LPEKHGTVIIGVGQAAGWPWATSYASTVVNTSFLSHGEWPSAGARSAGIQTADACSSAWSNKG